MGSHTRSIRRRIYLLLAIPLLTVLVLYAFVLYTTVGDAVNLARGPSLINATSVPTAMFNTYVQAERRASMVYMAAPTPANRATLLAAQAATARAYPMLQMNLTSPATTRNATASELAVIRKLLADANALTSVRAGVTTRTISPALAFGAFNQVIVDELHLFLEEVASLTDAHAAVQATANTQTVEAREFLLQEDALVSASLAAGQLTLAARVQISQLAGARQTAFVNGMAAFDPTNMAAFAGPMAKYAPPATLAQLMTLEQAIGADSTGKPPFTADVWDPVAQSVAAGYFAGGLNTARGFVAYDNRVTTAAWRRVWLAGGLGLIGLIGALVLSIFVARGIIRRLDRLRESALTLANVQLPDVVGRLRRGEDVNVEASMAAAPMQLGDDEIGQVGRAFETARRTAIRAAVDEARLRRGVSDVFRNLARRSQSLLHRQLSVLDGMERRASDPHELEDLFRLDHLATRMRRHAENLIILSGAAPGRGWRNPVPLVDVLRAAAAEVEDYARIKVVVTTQAALAGPAVGDVIHMIAELAENGALYSPPHTPVMISGTLVGQGFAVEIEDRGLGLSAEQLAQINSQLADPPVFDLSGTDQLGLFVAGQLAKRHDILISLRNSPYGGTTAIVLIPNNLVVTAEGREVGPGQSALLVRNRPITRAEPMPAELIGGTPANGDVGIIATDRSATAASTVSAPLSSPAPAASWPQWRDWAGTDAVTGTGARPESDDLPRRVRQANLAPQLRNTPSRPPYVPDIGGLNARSPEQTRNTLSAIQRGWEAGRSVFDPVLPKRTAASDDQAPSSEAPGSGAPGSVTPTGWVSENDTAAWTYRSND